MNKKPDFIHGEILSNTYDGVEDDLLTAGLGKTGIEQGLLPEFEKLSAASLRKIAIYMNYRALMDFTADGGFGTLYGPNVSPGGKIEIGEGKIAGREYLAFSDDGTGRKNVTMMVQIPDCFDPENPMIITAPSSGSRGIYGAVGVVGQWALQRGFAVAYTDKGTGNGAHDLDRDTVNLITGESCPAKDARGRSIFTARLNSEKPPSLHAIAFKHAHGQQNSEADWGLYVLQAIEFAFYILNLPENFGQVTQDGQVEAVIVPEKTTVIAAGISNGGDAAIRAAELDRENRIDAVAVFAPNISPRPNPNIRIVQGNKCWAGSEAGKSLLDYMTLLNVYQPCANLAPGTRGVAPLNFLDETLCENRCFSLSEKGLLEGDTVERMAENAQKIINGHGILEEQNFLQPAHFDMGVVEAISVTYANAYGKFSVSDSLCGIGFAAIDQETNRPRLWPRDQAERVFGDASGIPPTGGVELINELSEAGPCKNRESVSGSGKRDMNLDGALCLRRLVTGGNREGEALSESEKEKHNRIMSGIEQVRASGMLGSIPTVIVHGACDAILPPNHTSRAYVALNSLVEPQSDRVRYYEITNAHHLDVLNLAEGFNSRYIPLLPYFYQALDLVWDHLRFDKPLPPSQVVKTRPRGKDENGNVPAIGPDNIPPVSRMPEEENIILAENGVLKINR